MLASSIPRQRATGNQDAIKMDATSADAILQAAQLGRLDLVSLLLTVLGIFIALAAFYAFVNVHRIAKKQATDVAETVSREIAENAANRYLQEELPNILSSNLELFRGVGDQSADGIAEAQQRPDMD